ncbi:MAG TPA: lactate racemase domain-containing protein [Gaiellaceae bacterium]
MRRVPLLYGSRLVVADAGEDAVAIAPPPPPDEPIADVGAAVRDALRFPLAGEPLEAMVPRGGRVTILVEPPALPVPGSSRDPRQAALAAASDELERVGVPTERQTILVAAGLARRPGRRTVESLVTPEFALRFRGEVVVHDAEDPRLVPLGASGDVPLSVAPTLVETDAVVTVGAAQTVLHGGPASLLAAGGAETARAATADSLLEAHSAPGWDLAVALERALARRVPLIGASLTLDLPRLSGALRGYPYERSAVTRIAASRLARAFRVVPSALRMRMLSSLSLELTASAAFGGPPSVAHAEALVRGVETGSAPLAEPLDTLCIGIPRTTLPLPRERPNALAAAALGLGYALRLWRDAFPVEQGGTAILVAPFRRRFAHPTQQPYRAFFQATRAGRESATLVEAERAAATDSRAVEAYRHGRTCHPRLPFADWDACRPALERLGAVLVAGCRDSAAARQLGFVPTHGISAAFEMARGLGGDGHRVGFLLSPPYFPLRVG